MLERLFDEVYTKFKLNFYRSIFKRFEEREATLTVVETFCVETIYAMGRPTINQFAQYLQISQANAAYKVASLIKKGYITKERSQQDKREYHLSVTEKFLDYYDISYSYVKEVVARLRERFPPEEVARIEAVLEVISRELMPETCGLEVGVAGRQGG
ncbi:MAG: winged helix-turn-helix transcriptional regulator [Angelakisella sp.]|jgi:DNA-binding MarR family transcriptional regulator|nr:winged helix-turn-helix transcriptional regulator [Angelakisella sp.]MCI9529422.1 winged helix-turn-helix transcriptional regulator [Angelakisella sp.]